MAPETIMLIAAFIFVLLAWRLEARSRQWWQNQFREERRARVVMLRQAARQHEAQQIVRARREQIGRMN